MKQQDLITYWATALSTFLSVLTFMLMYEITWYVLGSCVVSLIVFGITFYYFTSENRRKKKILRQPFPDYYREILKKYVAYYNELPETYQRQFEKRIQLFLSEIKITGVDTPVTETDKILVAASAIIPVFAFPNFEYPNLKEVILYPSSFDKKFQTSNKFSQEEKNILGMVGNGVVTGKLLLSKPDLYAAFEGKRSKQNVGIHEFVHLLDAADGATDGVPEILFEKSYVLPWLKLMKKEMAKIKNRHSDISPYALTNPAEFLAVVSEYFFTNPDKFKQRHPELYAILEKAFKPDFWKQHKQALKKVVLP